MKKQSLIRGTVILGIAGIFARFLGIFFRWPLIMLIGDEGIGYYQMSYPMYMFFIATASGIPVAISKMVSERNAMGDKDGAILVLRKALILMFIIGGGFTTFILIFSNSLIDFLNWDKKSYYSLIAIALAPLFISVVSAFRGFFQGMQNMNPTAISQIFEQLGRVIVGVGLAYILLPRGIEYSAGGAAFGAVAGAVVAGIYLISKYISVRKEFKVVSHKKNHDIMSKLLYIAIPISLGSAVSSIMGLLDSIIVPQKLLIAGFNYKQATIIYGQLTGKAFVLVNVPLTLSIALCASLVPIISEAYILNRKKEVLNKLQSAIKVSMVIAIPSLCGLFFMSRPILNLIFPGHGDGYLILKYLSICIPFIVLAQTSTAILQGIGKYFYPVINLFLGCVVKVTITLFLVPIPEINVYGAIVGTILGYMTAAMLNIRLVKKCLNVKISFYDSIIKPAYASIIMVITVVFIYSNVYNNTMSNGIACFVAIFLGVIIYLILILVFGIFSYSQIKRRIARKH
ncbi:MULTISPECIES: polysaccharide biosynthesis protein [Clostridium]|jgi:stage V sporulation protein B|uniref:putative polysaccharide biosynthesis protein n=1 Tax=Clostridium TaxID=1485 RepID=UPI0002890B98|nr:MULTISPECIES: polysaccharide biosynthesis protein [Clostridium]MDF2502964.1 rane protein involved in the export of O-antigen and teichoic acid [Clostridium sp.]